MNNYEPQGLQRWAKFDPFETRLRVELKPSPWLKLMREYVAALKVRDFEKADGIRVKLDRLESGRWEEKSEK
jgi:hypothetical protein